ncbi:2-oxo-4-hydroxy-4-carboxy-5-ureidoimidazoline decarboxylase [Acinetobacter sp. B5B]|uniref:2-oxo-4-hydroxy-4-carboxy-5-ureidoimidazoline decarboxylase n=1 Tax=Acinetobacter baretiae TaxID=2605383 RepID=UPI0018C299B8|nr:2-oxo-4-hydroxy-4-carboxy-5-ureidoimidazoline decarboxylase [Acinetobacter baretiae]MBF7681840.1 2-oxo-4-hydroxy-4-carboxy-5-ureidoimidazoline decarboxylase [Acinetobacter baretiae]MBF7686225.1 2-oxo-4-hydroxy-4-carboxy-5-ureidoimidazoline decarboxylase [Acinetobacter baretiae]
MQLNQFNQVPLPDATSLLKHCVNIDSWVTHIEQQRPFKSKSELLSCATQQTQTWSWADIASALSKHPRIGEKPSTSQLSVQEQKYSNTEQAKISQDQDTQQALLQGNMAYEAKFGFIFLIKAVGLSSQEVLKQLHSRLHHDIHTEQQVVKQQLALIALHRLDQGIDP